ncbi:MAG TPA: hypothetical protein VMV08_00070 [Gaiellaceae bacterium]|nr:hypothetical protein [Gaiellaceae bacterium]
MSYVTELIERLGKALRPTKAAPAPSEAPVSTLEPLPTPVEQPSVVDDSAVGAIAGE